MERNRRDFIKASAAVGLIGPSQASAEPSQASAKSASSTPWIGFLHSTALEPDLEQAFIDGLQSDNTTPNQWYGDPSSPINVSNKVIIRKVGVRGRYGRALTTPLKNAAEDTQKLTPNPAIIVAAGGNVVGVAVNNLTYDSSSPIPVLLAMGRPDSSINKSNIKKIILEEQSKNLLEQKIDMLKNNFSVTDMSQMTLFYNGNSAMAQAQLNDWSEVTNGQGKQIDASEPANFTSTVGTTDKDNAKIPLREAFQAALNRTSDQTPRAIILSADPYFTMRRGKIIRIIKHLTTKKQNQVKNLVMCYPLDEYDQDAKDAGFDPEKDFAIVGPSLADVYFTLGKRAAQILGSKGIVPDSEGATIIKKPT